ncbi:efflux RND transporter periplasmic adaptor subunit [Parvularcula sp. ZS-1/3]|uniref:Efflux RND transporter periplasmic adaptor subunit n=2 Tax=Parvularcula mediterranea TaxID=2732508 RepID=A0A7Y3W5R5_9PROT|nr:efflux RND transporter periplasmic adaptor subunit [Parvularcula mediterranea]
MHPHYISTDPDGSCPICGMDLVPASSDAALPTTGSAGIAVTPEIIQTIGVRTAVAKVTPMTQMLRAFGTVEANERQETVVASRVEGWIEDLAVRAVGDPVDPGTVLYRLYSPDLIAAQKDFLNALDIGNEARISAVRQRLVSLGMQGPSIAELERSREVIERVAIRAEDGGIVSELNTRDGDYIKPGDDVMTLQSYEDVWVIADMPEQDLHLVSAGQAATLDFPSAPDADSSGRVDYVYPTVDPATRTGRLRIVVSNASGRLRPGAYADIRIETEAGAMLAVPSEAVLRDSRGAHVILALGEGRFLPRVVETGMSAGGMTEIEAGLQEGDRVVASGQYLLDSEAKLREGFSSLNRLQADEDTPLDRIPLDQATLAQIDHFADMALYFHEALTDGYAIEPSFIDPLLTLSESLAGRFGGTRLGPIVTETQAALREAKAAEKGEPLAEALSDLMEAFEPWLMEGAPQHYADEGLTLFRDVNGHLWLQESSVLRNPYGTADAESVAWPERMAAVRETEPRPASDPHANH